MNKELAILIVAILILLLIIIEIVTGYMLPGDQGKIFREIFEGGNHGISRHN